MELSISLATQICALFTMIVVGYLLVKRQILKISDSIVLSKIVLYVVAPCAIINSFQIEMDESKVYGFGLSLFAAIIINLTFIIITQILSKFFNFNEIEKASIIYANCGNLIIPLVSIVLGPEMVFYTSGSMIMSTIMLWTHCKFMISKDYSFDLKKIFLNFNIISIIIGLFLFALQIKLPTVLQSATTSMANLMGPLSMFVVGMLLTQVDLKELFSNKRVYLISFFRLIVLPIVILLIFVYSGLMNLVANGDAILMISLLAASAPAASTVTQFAQLYDNSPTYASLINTQSVLFCIITMPVINMIYMYLISK